MERDLERLKQYLKSNNDIVKVAKVNALIELSKNPDLIKNAGVADWISGLSNMSAGQMAGGAAGAIIGKNVATGFARGFGFEEPWQQLLAQVGGGLAGGYFGSKIPGWIGDLASTYTHQNIDPTKQFDQKIMQFSGGKNIFKTQDWLDQKTNSRY